MRYDLEEIMQYSKKLNILYVEDNKDVRESTILVLEQFFKEITIAVNGKDGLDKFAKNSFDLIITDINMPKMNGLDMITEIRKSNLEVPILILSAYNESEFFINSIKLGVEGYLLKPVDIEQFIGVLSKITVKLKLKKQVETNLWFLEQYQEATNNSSIVSKTDLRGVITYVNDAFCELSEYSRENLIGLSHNIVRHPKNPKSLYSNMWKTIKKDKKIWKGLLRNLSKNGNSYYVKTTIKPILDSENNIVEYIAIRDDVSDIMNQKKQLEDFIDTTQNTLAVMIKIENFEETEKLYGKEMLHKIEEKFTEIIVNNRPEDCKFEKVFPIGYGKYVLAKNKDHCETEIDDLIIKLQVFQEKLNLTKIDTGNFDYDISVLISLAFGEDILANLNYGICKLEDNKEIFILANGLSIKENENAEKNMQTITMVKTAINELKVISYFQPIINNITQEIEKYESLVRIIDSNGKVLSPYFFLDVAKKGKYYSKITEIVFKNSFKALKLTDKEISINVSSLDIERKDSRNFILKLLKECKEDTSRLVFELLEDESVKNPQVITEFIAKVKNMGVKIAIDDFGVGYSNFERLLDYQPDILKIDGYLIKDIVTNRYSASIVETIINFAKKQNLVTVAEYVENREIFERLKEMGVDYSQGYYFGKPEPLFSLLKI